MISQARHSGADGMPCGHAVELAIDDVPRHVVRNRREFDRVHAVRRRRFEDDVRLIEIERSPLAPHYQLRVDEKIDAAVRVAKQIDVAASALDDRKARVAGVHAGVAADKAASLRR